MRSGDKTQIILFVELTTDIASECVASTTRRNTPTRTLVWVGPQQVAHASFVWVKNDTLQRPSGYSIDFHHTVQFADLVQSRNGRRQTSMKSKDFVFNECCDRHVIKQICEILPHRCIAVLPDALIIEPVSVHEHDICVVYTRVICLLSWFPRRMYKRSG